MDELTYYKKCLLFSYCTCLGALFLVGTREMFSISYALIMIFMCLRAFRIQVSLYTQVYLVVCYVLIATGQLVYCNAVPVSHFWVNRLFCTLLLTIPYLVEKVCTVKKYVYFRFPSLDELYVTSFSELNHGKDQLFSAARRLRSTGKNLSVENLEEILEDLPRHSSFKYVSNGNLTPRYFEKAYESLDDPHIYLVISDTGSPASEVISVFTQKHFNHASLAFDYDLQTIVSYNGGEQIYPPGLNLEMVELFCKKEDATILVYSLDATLEQKKAIIQKIETINKEGSAYNLLGLLFKQSFKPNIMFCSHFVYKMLEEGDLLFFEKGNGQVRPTDFIELDYYRKLHFEYEIVGKELHKGLQLVQTNSAK